MESQPDEKFLTGQPAPDFQLKAPDGSSYRLCNFEGRILVLNFWSAECAASERVDKLLAPMLQRWGQRVALVCVASNTNETIAELASTAAQRSLPLVLIDEQHHTADLFAAQTTPHFFVIDPQGIVRYQGAFDDVTFRNRTPSQNFVEEAVEALLAGKLPKVTSTHSYGCAIVRFFP